MRIVCSGRLAIAVALLLMHAADPAFAGSSRDPGDTAWRERAVREQRCPASPINVPARVLRASGAGLKQRITVAGDTLRIEGTAAPDHIALKRGGGDGMVRIVWNGQKLGAFGPADRMLVRGGAGDDVVIVAADIDVPARIEGGAGHDCLQGGGAPAVLFGGAGDDVLIAGTGRPALHAGPGANRIVVPRRMGEVRVGPKADPGVLKALNQLYTLRRLGSGASGRAAPPTPIILGAADLRDGRISPLLMEAYRAGQAVVLTSATASDAAGLRTLLGHPSASDSPGEDGMAGLMFVRKALRPGTRANDYSTGGFARALMATRGPSGRHVPDERTIELLSRVLSAAAIVPEGPTDTPSNDLLTLAESYTSSWVNGAADGTQVQLVNSVWSVRSFEQQVCPPTCTSDFYYVRQEVDYVVTQSGVWVGEASSQVSPLAQPPTLIQTSPGSTQCTESTSSGTTWSVGGSVGWNALQGLNAALSGGVSVSDSQELTCPQLTINNEEDPESGVPMWVYGGPVSPIGNSETITFYNEWIWQVPVTSYATGQLNVDIKAQAQSCVLVAQDCPAVTTSLLSVVPLPFGDTFALDPPTVLSVNPTCANVGTAFVISGIGFYPSLVTSVLIDGTPLDSTQYTVNSDTSITVIAPEQSGEALPVAVQTTQGLSQQDVTIEISIIDLCGT